ncbi:manganese-dependent inorganic pyrophosphatase [Ruminococcaceae bacterium OttesenSCG-928-A11]|nr:manganese-dependent inorganic pyrophosphatase [Ruminococcaceae bacterium OttesenSCG-928-A11]
MSILVFGHKSPDTDSVVSAIAEAAMLNSCKGEGTAEARVQGEINPETKFVLDKFNLEAPKVLEDVSGKEVTLVDTTDPMQLPDNISEADVKYVFDHHQLGGLKTNSPFEGWFRPVGCTCTILKKVADKYGDEIPANVAGAMLCAILSDTVLFKSPTTTDNDKEVAEQLAKMAGVEDIEALGMEMLRVKSSITNDTATDLIKRDFKEFDFSGKKFGIGQVELIELSMIDSKLSDIKNEMQKMKNDNGYFGIIMLITDIMKEGSLVVAFTDDNEKIGEILGGEFSDNQVYIDGMMSRKKQVVAPLTEKL